jgi:hypothetical protein
VLKGLLHVTGAVLLLLGLMIAGHQIIRADMSNMSSAETTATLPPVGDAAKGATGAPGIGAYLRAVLGGVLDLARRLKRTGFRRPHTPARSWRRIATRTSERNPSMAGAGLRHSM